MNKVQKLALAIIPLVILVALGIYFYKQNSKIDFTTNQTSGKLMLSDFRGKQVLVYFGYGLCPDICPTTLVAVSEALNKIKDTNNIEVIFITLDPERDKLDGLDKFVKYFHPKIIATNTDINNTNKIADKFGVKFQKVTQPNSSIGYTVAHSADLYLIDENGKLKAKLPFGVSPDEIIKALQTK